MEKISFEKFILAFPSENNLDEQTIQKRNSRHQRSFIQQMSDIWGEADKCITLKNENKERSLNEQIKVFMDVVNSSLTDPKLTKGAKEELIRAEWEILDYCIWDNEWKNSGRTAMEWFDQWMFDYNYSLR